VWAIIWDVILPAPLFFWYLAWLDVRDLCGVREAEAEHELSYMLREAANLIVTESQGGGEPGMIECPMCRTFGVVETAWRNRVKDATTGEVETCCICLDKLERPAGSSKRLEVAIAACGHTFHQVCLSRLRVYA